MAGTATVRPIRLLAKGTTHATKVEATEIIRVQLRLPAVGPTVKKEPLAGQRGSKQKDIKGKGKGIAQNGTIPDGTLSQGYKQSKHKH